MIPFNKPHLTGKETFYMHDAVFSEGKISGNGKYTKKCQEFFEQKYGIKKCLLTTSCTDALEMCAILLDIQEGDEVIIPSFTFVSTALAFIRQGAKVIFADSGADSPNIDEDSIEDLITDKTKAIVVVHYAGVSCNMNKIKDLSDKYNLYIVEDAAQAIESKYEGMYLGSIGHLSTFSFHETKNISCGEGGLLGINDESFVKRSEIIWEKGTNRAEFFRGEVNKYGWVDTGSSFLPSDILAAFLYAQLENVTDIQRKRLDLWTRYHSELKRFGDRGEFMLPDIPHYATNNAHMFYLMFKSSAERDRMMNFLKSNKILAVFHYLPLHKSDYYKDKYEGVELMNCDNYSDCILRLPLYYDLSEEEQGDIIDLIHKYYN